MTNTLDDKVLQDIRMLIEASDPARGSGDEGVFWEELSDKHASLIREHGFQNFKRTINFEYSQWGVTSLRDRKISHLARGLWRQGRFPVGGLLTRIGDNQAGIRWPDAIHAHTGAAVQQAGFGGRLRLRAYAFYCGLLWQYALSEDKLGCLEILEPTLGNPLPIFYRGRLISQDLALSSLGLNLIASRLPMGRIRKVLEIGAGYGRLAFLFRKIFPEIEYSILDISPALAISRNYLEGVFGGDAVSSYQLGGSWRPEEGRINFMVPRVIDDVPDGYFDLVINVSSFDEMRPEVVEDYFKSIARVGSGWMYLQGYEGSRAPGRRIGLKDFPYGSDWSEVFGRQDPVEPRFIEKVMKKRVSAES
jgi:putative sugar O-methyltransferase